MAKIKDFVGHLARMHKNILTTDPKIWKGKYLIGQKAMVDYLNFLPARCESFLENCKRIDQFKPIFDKYSKFMINGDYYLYVEKQAYIDLGLLPVIVHGDAYGGNVIYAIDKDGKICDKISALIDWQLMHEGSPMEDLARFLVQCCDGILRRKAETFIFEYYLECLEKEFGDDKTKVPYTLEQLKKAYKYSFIAQAFFIPSYEIALNAKSDDASEIKEANHEFGVSKAFDALQDVDQILQGELKTFFEKYNC
uniref:CHK kinase-like domain-containing protein n=1 Tax=Panagrolaimus sp. PS1159 TaxID=55785 RepID=A0AC35F746_9BILA